MSKIDNIKWLIVVKECHRCQILLKISICSDPKVQYFFSHEEHPQQPWLTTRETLLLVSLAPCSSCWFSTCFWPQGQFHCRDLFGKISVEYNVWTEQRRIRIFPNHIWIIFVGGLRWLLDVFSWKCYTSCLLFPQNYVRQFVFNLDYVSNFWLFFGSLFC